MAPRTSARKVRNCVAVSASVQPRSTASTNLQIEYFPPEQLRPASNNARTHSKKQVGQIARSIARFGFVNPVLIAEDLEIVAGHGRVEAAKLLGLRLVPALRLSSLSPADRRAYVIADNRLAELAGWDAALLATELKGLFDTQFDDVELTGFALDEIKDLLDDAGAGDDKADEPTPDVAASGRGAVVSQAGDRWILGAHRLLCADAAPDCDVVVRRWQQYTGEAARLEGSGLTFAEVAALRGAAHTASTGTSRRE